jgi:hypothetical protein
MMQKTSQWKQQRHTTRKVKREATRAALRKEKIAKKNRAAMGRPSKKINKQQRRLINEYLAQTARANVFSRIGSALGLNRAGEGRAKKPTSAK